MKKLLILLFGVLVGLPALSQTYRIGEITQSWIPKHVHVADGLVYKYKLYDKYDTALRFDIGPDPDTFDVTITFKKRIPVTPLPDIVSTIDDNVISAAQVYSPATNFGDNVYQPAVAWAHMKNQPWNQNPDGTPIHYNKTVSVVEAAGAYVELTCACYKIEWWGEKRNNHGIVSVQVDGGATVDVDTYDPTSSNNSNMLWSPDPFSSNGTHKFRVNYTGRRHPASVSNSIVHDKFVIYTKQ